MAFRTRPAASPIERNRAEYRLTRSRTCREAGVTSEQFDAYAAWLARDAIANRNMTDTCGSLWAWAARQTRMNAAAGYIPEWA